MLTSLLERLQPKQELKQPPSRYAAWAGARRRLQRDCNLGKSPAFKILRGYLAGVPEDQKQDALQDLIAVHLLWSWKNPNGHRLETYVDSYPELGAVEQLPLEMIEDELLARYQHPHGDFPSIESYRKRFSSRPEVVEYLSDRCLDGGRYLKLRRIGIGSAAVVWEAFDRGACREVAIKEPLTAVSSTDDKPHPFSVEAKTTASLDHPGIVSMVEVIPNGDGPVFFVMPLAGTSSLSEKIALRHQKLGKISKPRLFEQKVHDLLLSLVQICDAVDYAHSRGILHCDLKPDNIACTDHGDIGVIDWGLAVRMPESTKGSGGDRSGTGPRRLAGTPHYMAPEQMNGLIDVRTEVFGLGAILYEILTGQPPYHWSEIDDEAGDASSGTARPENWAELISKGMFPQPRKLSRRIPKPLEAICLKAMAVEPAERQESAAALAGDLRAYLSDAKGVPWFRLE